MEDKNETKQILVRLETKVDNISKIMERNEPAIQTIPLTQYKVDEQKRILENHTKNIETLNTDINKAKGWAAAIGAISGLAISWLKTKIT